MAYTMGGDGVGVGEARLQNVVKGGIAQEKIGHSLALWHWCPALRDIFQDGDRRSGRIVVVIILDGKGGGFLISRDSRSKRQTSGDGGSGNPIAVEGADERMIGCRRHWHTQSEPLERLQEPHVSLAKL